MKNIFCYVTVNIHSITCSIHIFSEASAETNSCVSSCLLRGYNSLYELKEKNWWCQSRFSSTHCSTEFQQKLKHLWLIHYSQTASHSFSLYLYDSRVQSSACRGGQKEGLLCMSEVCIKLTCVFSSFDQ